MTSTSADTLARWRRATRRLRRRVLAHRRLLAAVLAMAAVALGVHAARPPAAATTAVAVARHDLAAGEVLTGADLTSVRLPVGVVPAGSVPAGRLTSLRGRMLAGPVRRGEPITDVRLVSATLTAGRPDLTAVPVRLPDAGMAGLLQVGDHLRLLATDPQGGTTSTVASDVLVLAMPSADGGGGGVSDQAHAADGVTNASGGRLVVIGIPADLVTPVTSAAVRDFLTYAFAH